MTVNQMESPLGWLHAHGHLDDRLFDAGERLRADYERAQLAPGVTMRWDPVRIRSSGERGLTPTERHLAARRRFDEAMRLPAAGWPTSSGAWSARARPCPWRKRRSPGPPGAASWSCGSRSNGCRNTTAGSDAAAPA